MTGYSAEDVRSARSLLFVPGNRPERFEKATSSGADLVVLDLEDAVAPPDKAVARDCVRNWLHAGNNGMVRINAADTVWHEDDVALITQTSASVMLPKADRPDVIERFLPGAVVLPLVETAAGIGAVGAVSKARGVHRLALGTVDLAAQLGIDPTDREALLFARSAVVFASAAAGLAPPIDGVTTALTDRRATIDDVVYARRLGLTGKLCIHPSQISAVHEASAPSDDEITWARKVLAASHSVGASAVDGQMVDLPVLLRAKRVLDAVGRR